MKVLCHLVEPIRMYELKRLVETLGEKEGGNFNLTLQKNRVQICIIWLGSAILIGLFMTQWIVALMAFFLIPVVAYGYTKSFLADVDKNKSKQWQDAMPRLARSFIISISSGMHPQNAFLEVFSQIKHDRWIGNDVQLTLLKIKQGALLENALISLTYKVDLPPLTKLCRLILQFERTGNPLIIFHMEQLLEEVAFQKSSAFKMKVEAADLFTLMPIGINFLLLMLLLMSPIFLGGLNV